MMAAPAQRLITIGRYFVEMMSGRRSDRDV